MSGTVARIRVNKLPVEVVIAAILLRMLSMPVSNYTLAYIKSYKLSLGPFWRATQSLVRTKLLNYRYNL